MSQARKSLPRGVHARDVLELSLGSIVESVPVRFWRDGEIAPTCHGCKMTAQVVYFFRFSSLCSSCAALDSLAVRS